MKNNLIQIVLKVITRAVPVNKEVQLTFDFANLLTSLSGGAELRGQYYQTCLREVLLFLKGFLICM